MNFAALGAVDVADGTLEVRIETFAGKVHRLYIENAMETALNERAKTEGAEEVEIQRAEEVQYNMKSAQKNKAEVVRTSKQLLEVMQDAPEGMFSTEEVEQVKAQINKLEAHTVEEESEEALAAIMAMNKSGDVLCREMYERLGLE